jgi:hypothetical protein
MFKVQKIIRTSVHHQVLKLKGFPSVFCDWVMKKITGGNVRIRSNVNVGSYLKTHQGLRHEDPLSSIVFDLDVHVLAAVLDRAK